MAKMKKKIFSTEFKVGLTVIIASFILIYGIIWGKGYRLKTNKYQVQIVFDNIGGLVPGDPVTVNGYKEGKVVRIDWKGRKILCTIELNDHVQLYEDATFTIISAELLAGMKIEIFPGKSDKKINMALQPFKGKYGGRIVDVGLTIDKLARDMSGLTYRLDSTTAMLNQILRSGELEKHLNTILANLSQTSESFKTVPDSLNKTLMVLNQSIRQINGVISENKTPLKQSLKSLQSVATQVDSISVSLKAIVKQIESRQGSLGKAIYDSTLYQNLNKTLLTVDSLADRIRKKGLKLSLF